MQKFQNFLKIFYCAIFSKLLQIYMTDFICIYMIFNQLCILDLALQLK